VYVFIIFKGNFQGELLLNGRPVSEDVMIKISGFVAQEDISFVQLTVLEQLKLMASIFGVRIKITEHPMPLGIYDARFFRPD